MAVIKKFRIKSFKKINTIIEFKDISLAYGNRLILDKIFLLSSLKKDSTEKGMLNISFSE